MPLLHGVVPATLRALRARVADGVRQQAGVSLLKVSLSALPADEMLFGFAPLGSAAELDAMLTSSAAGDEHAGSATPLSPPAHWSLDDILWSPDAVAAVAAPPGTAAGALRPALLESPIEGAPAPRPGRKAGGAGSKAVACQALGCGASLDGAAPYHVRNRLCADHVRADSILLAPSTQPQRICQARPASSRAPCASCASAPRSVPRDAPRRVLVGRRGRAA